MENRLEYLKNINKFNKTIPIFENHVRINNNKIEGDNFNCFVNNVRNCKNIFLMLIKDDSIVKIPNKSCSNIQMHIDNEKFQRFQSIIILMHLLILKTDLFIQMNFY